MSRWSEAYLVITGHTGGYTIRYKNGSSLRGYDEKEACRNRPQELPVARFNLADTDTAIVAAVSGIPLVHYLAVLDLFGIPVEPGNLAADIEKAKEHQAVRSTAARLKRVLKEVRARRQ